MFLAPSYMTTVGTEPAKTIVGSLDGSECTDDAGQDCRANIGAELASAAAGDNRDGGRRARGRSRRRDIAAASRGVAVRGDRDVAALRRRGARWRRHHDRCGWCNRIRS